jgi:hypothetical protein
VALKAQTTQFTGNMLPITCDIQAAGQGRRNWVVGAVAPNFPACFLAEGCPHLKTDGPCNTVRHCRVGWLAGWWCLNLRRLLAQGLMKRYPEREALYAEFSVEHGKQDRSRQ